MMQRQIKDTMGLFCTRDKHPSAMVSAGQIAKHDIKLPDDGLSRELWEPMIHLGDCMEPEVTRQLDCMSDEDLGAGKLAKRIS